LKYALNGHILTRKEYEMDSRLVVKRILKGGGKFVRHGKKHDIYRGPNGNFDQVPRHGDVKEGTAASIFSHLGV
jgi:predicted RNA binding protein YcfA (HicA-like mRNA interferase family)